MCSTRVAEAVSLSAKAIMPTKTIVKRAFAIFAKNASFLQYIPCRNALLAHVVIFCPMSPKKCVNLNI